MNSSACHATYYDSFSLVGSLVCVEYQKMLALFFFLIKLHKLNVDLKEHGLELFNLN